MTPARFFRLAGCTALLCLLSGCASNEPMPPSNKFLVSVKNAQFYKYGPAQAFGADFNLVQGQKVTMLKREYGYSRVMLEDGTSGYMATEELKPAPPEPPPPKPAPVRKSSGGGWFSSGKPKRSNVQPTPTDPLFDVNDVPLPLPDEEPVPTSKPDFRYPKPEPGFRF
ncbi:MAG: hypothetical protein EOP84_29890 [Verrucomicrobiaceae bacterium]|nr:MAG: hypothetical protein EOP84_29890 [Verrucomicrobiaceae bacterium]